MAGEEFLVDPGTIVKPFDIGLAQQVTEVVIPLVVLDQEEEVKMMGVAAVACLVEPAAGRRVDLAAQDGLDVAGLGLLEEGHRSEDVAVVGQGHGRHLVLVGRFHQGGHLRGPVQYAVFGVVMKMDE